jgi:ribosomal protein L24
MTFGQAISGDKVMIGGGTYSGFRGKVVSLTDGTARVRLSGGQDCEAGQIVVLKVDQLSTYYRPRYQ